MFSPSEFAEEGCTTIPAWIPPKRCRAVVDDFESIPPKEPVAWRKGFVLSDERIFRFGTDPILLNHMQELLGSDVLLCGGLLLERDRGAIHPWHCDMETAHPDGGIATVWLGLSNIEANSTMQVISRSHLLGKTIQQAAHEKEILREDLTANQALELARDIHPDCRLLTPEVEEGGALIFDGRLWHGSHNTSGKVRLALLLHYARPEAPFREGDLRHLGWPIRTKEHRPPCLVVRGGAEDRVNCIEPTPVWSTEERPPATEHRYPLQVPFDRHNEQEWSVQYLFQAAAPYLDELTAHSSRLEPGACPHKPHRHPHEEILFVLQGTLDVIQGRFGRRTKRLSEGDFVFLPRQCFHTLKNSSIAPAFYLIFKWRNAATRGPCAGDPCFGRFAAEKAWTDVGSEGRFSAIGLFDQPLRHLTRLSIHRSRLAPGGGYPPHADAYNVVLVMLEGTVETNGTRCSDHDVYTYPAGAQHGIRNTSTEDAEYLILEFHA